MCCGEAGILSGSGTGQMGSSIDDSWKIFPEQKPKARETLLVVTAQGEKGAVTQRGTGGRWKLSKQKGMKKRIKEKKRNETRSSAENSQKQRWRKEILNYVIK